MKWQRFLSFTLRPRLGRSASQGKGCARLAVVTLVGDTLLIPVEIRRLLHLSPRDAVRMEPVGNTLVLRPVSRHAGGTLCRGGKSRLVPLMARRGGGRPTDGVPTPPDRCERARVADVAEAVRR
jgi:hypothetical protein